MSEIEKLEKLSLLMFEQMKHIRKTVERTAEDVQDLKVRMGRLESAMLSVKREVADGFESDIRQQNSIDKINERLDRIERRLELEG
jgi:tRNA A-37 threonylcarbamoyl transferase component Bud32